MFSPSTTESLRMLRLQPRAGTPSSGPTKRPTGGRPNPCAEYRYPSHPLALIADAVRTQRRTNKRKQQLRTIAVPRWKAFSLAVQRGEIPVNTVLSRKQINQVTGLSAGFCLNALALTLSQNRAPVRLREIGHRKWVADFAAA